MSLRNNNRIKHFVLAGTHGTPRAGSGFLLGIWYKTGTLLRGAAGSIGTIRTIGRSAMLFGNSEFANATPDPNGDRVGGRPPRAEQAFLQ